MKRTERERLLKIAHTALDAAERILAPTPPIPPTIEAIDRGARLAERTATIFSALADDDTARLLRRAAQREAAVDATVPIPEATREQVRELRTVAAEALKASGWKDTALDVLGGLPAIEAMRRLWGFTLADRDALAKLDALAVAQNERRTEASIPGAIASGKDRRVSPVQVSPCRAGGIGCSWEPWQEAIGCRTPDEARARAGHADLKLRVALETCTEYRHRAEQATTERDEARNEIEQLRRQVNDLGAALAEREQPMTPPSKEDAGKPAEHENGARGIVRRVYLSGDGEPREEVRVEVTVAGANGAPVGFLDPTEGWTLEASAGERERVKSARLAVGPAVARAVLCAAYWAAHAKGIRGVRGAAAMAIVREVANQATVDVHGALRWLELAEQSGSHHDSLLVAINLAEDAP